MKRISFFTIFSTLFFLLAFQISFAQINSQINPKKIERVVQTQDFRLKPQQKHPVAQKAIQRGVKPGVFKNVTYKYQKNVAVKPYNKLATVQPKIYKKGLIKKADTDQLQLSSDSIYLSQNSDLVLQTVQIDDNNMLIYKPKFEDVFKDFQLPHQIVPVTLANTSYTIEGATLSDEQNGSGYKVNMTFDHKEYTFEKEFNQGKNGKENTTKEKVKVHFVVNGNLSYNKPELEAEYGKKSGYRLVFHADEIADLTIEGDLEVDCEMSIPIWEFKIPASDIGEAKIGVFLVIGSGGKVHFDVLVDQSISIHSGVQGGTFYYVPTSVKTIHEFDSHCNIDYDLELTEIKVWSGVECVAQVKVKGYDILKLRARGIMQLTFDLEDDNKNYGVEAGLNLLIDGKVKKINKKFTILDKYYKIWEKREKNFGGYTLQIREADAYNDRVHGIIFKTQDSIAYQGPITLSVKHPNGSQNIYEGKTAADGVFAMIDIDLKKGDKVYVSIPDSPNPSPGIAASIPFTKIKLYYADYFTNSIKGSINDKVNTFPIDNIQKPAQATGHVPQGIIHNPVVNQNFKKIKPALNPVIEKLNFKDLITYQGDIKVAITPLPKAELLPIVPGINLQESKSKHKIKNRSNRIQKVEKNIPSTIIQNKAPQIKEVKNLPYGGFVVNNLDIKPYDKVQVSINIDGFELVSNVVMADGLIFSPMIDENFTGNAASRTFEADNTHAHISALRSDEIPVGEVRMFKGIDLKHTRTPNALPLKQTIKHELFPQSVKPVTFYDITQTIGKSDTTIRDALYIGPWAIDNPYYNPSNILPHKIGGHFMEYMGMEYEGYWIGYKNYQETCTSCGQDITDLIHSPDLLQESLSQGQNQMDIPIPDDIDIVKPKIKLMPIQKKPVKKLRKM